MLTAIKLIPSQPYLSMGNKNYIVMQLSIRCSLVVVIQGQQVVFVFVQDLLDVFATFNHLLVFLVLFL